MNSAITGLNNFQKMLDVVANNIANVNTAGYKHSKVNFQELFAQTLRPAASPNPSVGGANALQVGLGSSLATIDSVLTQGVLELTDNPTDLAISGEGYFSVGTDTSPFYTRNGHFQIDAEGSIVDSGGRPLRGWTASNGVIDPTQATSSLRIPFGDSMTAQATTQMKMAGNLDGSQAVYAAGPPPTGGRFVTESTVYDSLGQGYRVQLTFTKAVPAAGAAATWNWSADYGGANLGSGATSFDPNGAYLASASTANPSFTLNPTNGAAPIVVNPDFSTVTQLVTSGQASTLTASTQNGYPAGTLVTFSIDRNGTVVGQYSNALTRALGQVALAYFSNPQGLEKTSSGLLRESVNSGQAQLGVPGTSPRGELTAGALEASNVDLSKEFTRLIQAQRAFQANSKVITTMDEVLGEISNLRR